MGGSGDRRRHARLRTRLPLRLTADSPVDRFTRRATSENVSAGGVYFATDDPSEFPVGARFLVTIEVVGTDTLFTQPGRLSARGRVVRVDEQGARANSPTARQGVAVAFDEPLRFGHWIDDGGGPAFP